MGDFALYILLGIVNMATAIGGGLVSARTLPSGRERILFVWGFVILGALGVGLIVFSGIRTYQSQTMNASVQQKLQADLQSARDKMDQSLRSQENIKGQLTAFSTVLGTLATSRSDPALQRMAGAMMSLVKPPPVVSFEKQTTVTFTHNLNTLTPQLTC